VREANAGWRVAAADRDELERAACETLAHLLAPGFLHDAT
jgi:hypothetical protein